MNHKEFIDLHKEFSEKMHELVLRKNADYTGSSSSPFANFEGSNPFYKVPAVVGITERYKDKITRIKNYLESGEFKVTDETLEDTFLDAANYLFIFYAYLLTQKESGVKKPLSVVEEVVEEVVEQSASVDGWQ